MIYGTWAEYEPAETFTQAHRAQDRTMVAMARDVGISLAQLLVGFGRWPKWRFQRLSAETIERFHGSN